MRRGPRAGLALVCAVLTSLAVLGGPAQAASPLKVVKIDQSRFPNVTLTLSAAGDYSGTPAILENRGSVGGVSVENPQRTTDTCLAIDSSHSMTASALHDAIAAATQFANARRSGDQLCVDTFGDQAQSLQSLTGDTSSIATALGEVGTSQAAGTALYDAVVLASRDLAAATDTSRKVLVLLTDGTDTSSSADLATAIKTARDSNVTVYGIQLKTAASRSSKLLLITAATGGELFDGVTSADIASVYTRIGKDMRSNLRVSYVSKQSGAAPIRLSVSARGLGSASTTYQPTSTAPVVVSSGGGATGLAKLVRAGGSVGLAVAVGLAFLLATLLVLRTSPEAKLEKRLAVYTNVRRPGADEQRASGMLAVKQLVASTDRVFAQVKYWKRMSKLIEQADLAVKPSELFYIQIGVAIICAMIATLVFAPGFGSLVGGLAGFAAPYQWIKFKANKRRNEFEAELGDTLLGAAASLRAGHSFAQAIASIVKDGDGPVSKEFGRVENETRLGLSTDVAMDSMAQRVGSKNFEFVVIAVNIQRQVGGSLAEILDMVADTVRSREQFARKVKALTAMGRASSYVLIGMPFIMGGLIELVDSKYMRPLLFTTIGHVMIGVGLVSMSIGTMVLRKIVNFKY